MIYATRSYTSKSIMQKNLCPQRLSSNNSFVDSRIINKVICKQIVKSLSPDKRPQKSAFISKIFAITPLSPSETFLRKNLTLCKDKRKFNAQIFTLKKHNLDIIILENNLRLKTASSCLRMLTVGANSAQEKLALICSACKYALVDLESKKVVYNLS
jgi:hypothetical protein